MSQPPSTRQDAQHAPVSSYATRAIAAVHRRWPVLLALCLVATGVLLYLSRDIRIDNSLQIWFIDGEPVLEKWDDFKTEFGNDEFVVIGVTDPAGIYSPHTIARIRAASLRLEEHEKVRRVTSLGVSRHIDGDAVEIVTQPLVDDGPVTARSAELVKTRLAANPVFHGTIVATHDRMTLMVVELEAIEDLDRERPALLDDLREIARAELDVENTRHQMSGMGVVYEGLNAATLRDSAIFVSLSYVVVFLGLWLLFRRLRWVAIGGFIITLATLMMVGVCGASGRNLNMVVGVLPTLLMVVGILDLVHFVSAQQEHPRGQPRTRALVHTGLAAVAVPCAFNTLTDIAGFLALSSAPMSAIRDFGWLAAVGLALLYGVLMIVVVPALASPRNQTPRRRSGPGPLAVVCERVFDLVSRRRAWVLLASAALIAVSAIGISRIHIDTYTIGFLSENSQVRRDHDAIENTFGTFVPYEFLIKTDEPGGIKEPELLRKLERLERAFEDHPRVSRATGLPEIVSRLNQVVMDGDRDEHRIPDTRAAVAQELLLYEADERNDLELLVNNDSSVARVTVRADMPAVGTVGETIANLEAIGQEILGESATIEGVGYMAVYVRVIENIAVTQARTFAIALFIITLALMLFLRSVKLGLVALVPNLLPVVMTLGFMGFAGINLDVATVLIAAIVIGISVNDTSHLMFRFRQELRGGAGSAAVAVRSALVGTGRAIVASSLILAAGFGVLAFASVKSIAYFGLLCMLATLFALIADLIVTPALLLSIRTGAPAQLGRLGGNASEESSS